MFLTQPRINTAQRIEAMRRVTDLLAAGEMTARDIREKMDISDSGCRKYLSALSEGGIVRMVGRAQGNGKLLGQPIYRLTASGEQIERFLRAAAGLPPKPAKQSPGASGRLMHLLFCSAPAAGDQIVTRDPFALPVEFFKVRTSNPTLSELL